MLLGRAGSRVDTHGDVGAVLGESGGEDEVNLLESTASGLDVEEVDNGNEEGVHDGEEEEATPGSGIEEGRGELDDGEVEQPIGGGRDSIGVGASAEGVHLGGVQPERGGKGQRTASALEVGRCWR